MIVTVGKVTVETTERNYIAKNRNGIDRVFYRNSDAWDRSIRHAIKTNSIKLIKCECCGAPDSCSLLECPYCGSKKK